MELRLGPPRDVRLDRMISIQKNVWTDRSWGIMKEVEEYRIVQPLPRSLSSSLDSAELNM